MPYSAALDLHRAYSGVRDPRSRAHTGAATPKRLSGPGTTLPALVGFWRQDYSNPQVLHVINGNSFDIDNVTVRFNDGYFIRVGLVPSCQAWTLAVFTIPGAQANSTYTLQ
ncbi:hypothetical protein ACFQ7I_27275 [Streptomyces massasporeus]